MVAIAVIINSGGGGVEPTAPMAATLMVAAVDSGGNNGIFITASHDNDRHPHSNHPCPCPPSDKDWMVGWRACRDMSHLLLPRLLSLLPLLSPLVVQRHQGRQPQRQTRPSCQYPQPGRGGTPQPHWHGGTKTETETKTRTKSTTVAATSPPLRLQTATPVLTPLLPLHKQRRHQHGCSSGSSRPAESSIFSVPSL
jgi:hypothetical protein